MSGGSYEYLCFQEPEQVFAHEDQLSQMFERLNGLTYALDAANETKAILLEVQALKAKLESNRRLKDVWHAIEWWDSGDIGEDRVKEVLRQYKNT